MASAVLAATLAGCAHAPAPLAAGQVQLPLLRGWIDGQAVHYVTTDVSHPDAAAAKGANFAPRLAHALPVGPLQPGRRSAVDKVYPGPPPPYDAAARTRVSAPGAS